MSRKVENEKRASFSRYLRGDFKTQPPIDMRFRLVPGGCHRLEQKKPVGTGRKGRLISCWF